MIGKRLRVDAVNLFRNLLGVTQLSKKAVGGVGVHENGGLEVATTGASELGHELAGEIVADSGDGGRRLAQWLTEHDLTGTEHRA